VRKAVSGHAEQGDYSGQTTVILRDQKGGAQEEEQQTYRA
jgi:hypothetical protein